MSQVPVVVHFNDTNDHSPPTALTRTYTTAKANGVFVFIEMWVAVVVVVVFLNSSSFVLPSSLSLTWLFGYFAAWESL